MQNGREDSNRALLTQLQQAEASGAGSGTHESADVVLEKMPKFKNKVEEITWKMNKARKKLKMAKQYVALADKIALLRKKGRGDSKAVKGIIQKAEVALVHAGEHMGLDYVHFRK